MKLRNWIILLFLCALFSEVHILKIVSVSRMARLTTESVTASEYRAQEIGEKMLAYMRVYDDSPESIGVYLLESKFGYQTFHYPYTEKSFENLKKKWRHQSGWQEYRDFTRAIWSDVKYFPIPKSTTDAKKEVSYVNSWGAKRTYGGQRIHEGTDIIAAENIAGLYPVVSMTDGIIEKKGWLEKGGYRIGVKAPSGAYFYYAHLDSYANLKVGDNVKAGDILGFMGDSGYGTEGTTGMFPVHLHLGIYIYPNGEEMSVNPYWVLRLAERNRIKCSF